jgi:hypothetical protein
LNAHGLAVFDDQTGTGFRRKSPAIAGQKRKFEDGRALARQHLPLHLLQQAEVLGRHDQIDRPAEQFVAAVAGQVFAGSVEVGDVMVKVGGIDDVVGILE